MSNCDDCRCITDGTALCAFCAERRAEIKEMATELDSYRTRAHEAEAEMAMLERHRKMLLELVVDYTNGKARIEDAINVLHAVLTEEE